MLLCLLSDLQQRAFVLQISVRIGLQTLTYHGWKWGRGGKDNACRVVLLNFLGEIPFSRMFEYNEAFLNLNSHNFVRSDICLPENITFTDMF